MKKCRGVCQLHKPLSDYHVRSASPDGRSTICRECRNQDQVLKSYLKKKNKKSILLERQTFAKLYPTVNKTSFKSWVYRNTEINSLKGIFGDDLFNLVMRYMDRVDLRFKGGVK